MVLVIDNYDSFTYNLVQYLGELGADIVVRRNDAITVEEVRAMSPGRVVISPGPGRPEAAGITVELVRTFGSRVPILGVCLGHQAIGMAYGATVGRAGVLMHGKTSSVRHDGAGVFQGVENPFTAARYHSLLVERASLPPALVVTADTGDVIMGLRHREHPVHGVQFHPESIMTPAGMQILRNFLAIEGR